MTERQKKFCDEYILDCNATRAYKAAYPRIKSDNVAGAAGSRLLANVKIRAYIDERLAQISSTKIADAKEVLEYLTSVMRGETTSEVVVTELVGDGCSEARRMDKTPDEKERLKAAELIGKRYGLFEKRDDVSETLEKAKKLLEGIDSAF